MFKVDKDGNFILDADGNKIPIETKEAKVVETTKEAINEAVDLKANEIAVKSMTVMTENLTEVFNKFGELITSNKLAEKDKTPDGIMDAIRISVKPIKHRLGILAIGMAKAKFEQTTIYEQFDKMGIEKNSFGDITKVMNTGTIAAGGILVPEIWDDDIIPLLEAKAAFRKSGVGSRDMPNGNLTMPRWASGIKGYWVGEGQKRTSAQPTTEALTMKAHKLAVDVPITNEELKFSKYNTAREIQDLMITGTSNTEDTGFLYGTGTAYQPTGLETQMLTANKIAATGSATAEQIGTDLEKLPAILSNNNVTFNKPVWLMHPREYYAIRRQVDSTSNLMYYARELRETNTLIGYPVFMTTNIPTTGSGSDIFFYDAFYLSIGEAGKPELKFTENGDWYDGADVRSGQVEDTSVFKMTEMVDLVLKQQNAACELYNVTYGA